MIVVADQLTRAARERLREFGIALELESPARHLDAGIDAIGTLSRAGAEARYAVVVRHTMTLSSLAHEVIAAPPYPLLIIGERIGRRSAGAFRDAGLQFVDTLGNAFITFGDVLIEVQGRTGPAAETTRSGGRPRQPTNMFSPRRSQAILALLTWPELATANVRAIATAAGVSVGQAHDALAQLEQTGFLTSASRELHRADELLDYWAAAYPTGLGRRLDLARYHGDPSRPINRPDAGHAVYLSGESAKGTEIARPVTLTLYIDTLDPTLPILNRWSSSPDRVPNIFVRHKFWASPRPREDGPSTKVRNAPWPLVYADLMTAGDARLSEAAKVWRTRRARPGTV